MKDIILPSETSDAIDLGAINEDTNGIIIPYKGEDAIGYIAYTCGESSPWALFNVIDNTIIVSDNLNNDYSEESIALDNYNPDKLSSDTKKLMNKTGVWSL